MSAIIVANSRETVKDMVLADYRVPKGVSIYSSIQIQKLPVPDVFVACFDNFRVTNYQPTNHLTSWSRILLGKLIFAQIVTKFPAFYGIRRFIPCSQEIATGHYPEPY
jgi:hypothetical protein